ncbi:MAG: hypothetical protein RDU20_19565, partial [Desulfomonilaceae bacterium]|nr:hypothetical protein [Desulfomonilaceae bacterium]
MSAAPAIPCSTCETGLAAPYPFCPECGRLSPSFVRKGSIGVEIDEVPAEKLRGDLSALLRSWFPDVDVLDAKRRLESGKTLLLTGIDEDSAHRLVETLKTMKAPARLVRVDAGRSWVENLW